MKLENYFMPKKNMDIAGFAVSKQRPTEGDSVTYEQKTQNTGTLIEAIKDSKGVKRSIQKKWDLDRFLEESSHVWDMTHQVKDLKKISRYRKYSINRKIMQRKASEVDEETRWNRRNLTEKKNQRKRRKKKAKAGVSVGRQEHILVAETGQHRAVFTVCQV